MPTKDEVKEYIEEHIEDIFVRVKIDKFINVSLKQLREIEPNMAKDIEKAWINNGFIPHSIVRDKKDD